MSLPGLAVGLSTSLAANEVNGAGDSTDVIDLLQSIDKRLEALQAYAQRERERTPFIIEIGVTLTAGARSLAQDFNPPSSYNNEWLILTTSANAAIKLLMGTRGPTLNLSATFPNVLPLPYHFNGGTQVSIVDAGGAATATISGFLVGWLEQNRMGPIRVTGTDL